MADSGTKLLLTIIKWCTINNEMYSHSYDFLYLLNFMVKVYYIYGEPKSQILTSMVKILIYYIYGWFYYIYGG